MNYGMKFIILYVCVVYDILYENLLFNYWVPTRCTHIDPVLAGKHSDQFGVLVECAKILLIIDLGAVRVQVYGWLMVALFELLGHLGAYLL